MDSFDAANAAATRKGNVIFWVFVAGYLGLVGLFMLDVRQFNSQIADAASTATP